MLPSAFRARARGFHWLAARVRPGRATRARDGRDLGSRGASIRSMVILRFKIHSKPEKRDEVMGALEAIIPTARRTEGVIKFDIARVLLDPDAFIATAV
jgi:hypothetical protein